MFLGVACRGVVCPGGLTCIDGACVSVDTPIGIAVIEPTRGSEFDGGRDVMSNTDVSTGIVDGTADGSGALMTDSAAVDAGTDATTDAGVLTCAAARCPPIARIASIGDFTCALTAAGRIACWGANDEGQLGRGTILMRVGQGGGEPVPAYLRNAPSARAVLVAETHACLVTSPAQGEVWCWGNNALGSLGVGFVRSPLPDPARVPNFSTMGPLLFSGANRSIYWRTLNGLFAWGDNSDGALGTASANAVVTSASLVSMDRRMDSLSACGRGACWTEAQSIVCVGVNGGLRFGPVSALDETLRTPTRLPANFQADSVYVGDGYSCLLFQGVVKCWGENRASGILGAVPNAGDPALVSEPQTVQFGAPDIRVRSLALGGDFALAMTNTGQVFCWGSNAEGTCATGSIGPDGAVTPEHTTPTPLVFPPEFLSPVQMIAAGRSHACAVDSRDGIFCWGRNSRAQVGRPWSDDPRMRRFTRPVPVLLP
jgi:alpha-tubulin suppressor-like RCC1 family protein